jgi:hypothetical protein
MADSVSIEDVLWIALVLAALLFVVLADVLRWESPNPRKHRPLRKTRDYDRF